MKVMLALVMMLVANAGYAQDWPTADSYLFMSDDCSTSKDADWCTQAKGLWHKDYDAAINGDYQGERNVSFCLSNGCADIYRGALRKNPILGCAWRIVILKSGHLQVDQTDTDNFNLFCGAHYVDAAGLEAAKAQAIRILTKQGFKIN